MAAIGSLRTKEDRGGKRLEGSLATLEHSFALTLRPNAERRSERSPDWIVFAANRDGVETDIGRAWTITAKRGPMAGSEFLSLTLDDPSFAKPLNLAGYPAQDEPGVYRLDWKRRPERAAQAA